MHCMAWLHEEPVYQLLVLLLSHTHLETVILEIFSWMDFNVFYCNLVNILIHFFFPITGLLDESYLLGNWEGGGVEYTTSLPGRILQSLSTQWPTQLENSSFETLGYCFSHKDQEMQVGCGRKQTWLHGGTAFENRELRDSSEPCLSQLSFPLHVNSWVWCFNSHIFCLELWRMTEATTAVAHSGLLSFCSGQWWLGNNWRHTQLKLEQISLCYQGRKGIRKWNANATAGYWNLANLHPGDFLTVTGKITSVWGSGCVTLSGVR